MTDKLKSELDDAFGEQAVRAANEARLAKDARTGQKSLFWDYFEDENKKGMKQAAVDKYNKADEEKEAKKAQAANRKAAIRGGGGSGGSGGTSADLKMLYNPKSMKSGGKVKSASSRADGIAIRGKTRA